MEDDTKRLSENAGTLVRHQRLSESGEVLRDGIGNAKVDLAETEDCDIPKDGPDVSGEHEQNQTTVSFEWGGDGRLVAYTTDESGERKEEYGRFLKPDSQDDHSFCSDVAEMIERDIQKTVKWSMPSEKRRGIGTGTSFKGNRGQAKRDRTANPRLIAVAILCLTALAVAIALLTSNRSIMSSPNQVPENASSETPMFASEGEMREKVAGVYTEKPDGRYMIKISDNTMIRRHRDEQGVTDETYRIVSYDPVKGAINLEDGVAAVTRDGGLHFRFGYDRGGVWGDDQPSSQEQSSSSAQGTDVETPTFTFGDIRWKISETGSYVTYSSSITNNSSKSYKFVEVRLTFYDENSNVIDTDRTYAVGSEGIRPGETSQFDLMRKNNTRESRIGMEVIGYR